jgi:6-phospho-beta-glucosidase
MSKVTMIGGGGVRTPLVIHALAQAQSRLGISELALFDPDHERVGLMASLGREIVTRQGGDFRITAPTTLEEAVEDAAFVLSSIRVGGMEARARDERIAIEHGLAGQETTGPGGAAMALRTIPVTLSQSRVVERIAPRAWFINFTNPAGLITQALTQNTKLRVIGICDTPIELTHRIAWVLGEPYEDMAFDYAGLNHLGWVRHVHLRGEDITGRLLADPEALRRLYPADLFDPALIQVLGLVPTEYLFFYYSQRKAHENQVRAGASRGEELQRLNTDLFEQLRQAGEGQRLSIYRSYLLRRNSSYMKLEAQGESAFEIAQDDYDPFETVTGYHRIALDVMTGLVSDRAKEVVVNVGNDSAIDDLAPEDVVEVPCDIDCNGARPRRTGRLSSEVRGLVLSVKSYERATIRAALESSRLLAQLALMENPIIGQWELAGQLLRDLIAGDPEHLGYLS